MADESGRVEIEIVLDDGSVKRGFARVLSDGKDTASGLEGAFNSVRNSILKWGAAYLSLRAVSNFIGDTIQAAANQESAVNRLNTALKTAGSFSIEASNAFQEMANQIQKTTKFEDDHVLSLAATARAMSRTNEQAMILTKAAIELGVATGKGPDAAMQQLAGTLSGTAGRLTKIMPELQNFTAAQLKAGAAIEYVNARFAGTASAELNTYSGRLANLKNVFGDVKEELGNIFIKSPALLTVFKFLSEKLVQLGESVKAFAGKGDLLRPIILNAIDLGTVLTYSVGGALEFIYNLAKIVFEGIRTAVQTLIFGLAKGASMLVDLFAPNSALARGLRTFAESSKQTLADFSKGVADASENVLDFKVTTNIGAALSEARMAVETAMPVIAEKMADVTNSATMVDGTISSLGQSFVLMKDGAVAALDELNANARKTFAEIGASSIKVMIGGISNGMAAIGRALVKGENIFKAFAGAMLSALGQAAIQMGATYILMGVARLAASYGADPTGWQLIGTGSAMSVLGGALMAIGEGTSGGGASVGATGGGSGGGASAGAFGGPSQSPEFRDEERARITVNIQGSVFDTKETGLRITEIIQESFDTSGARIVSA